MRRWVLLACLGGTGCGGEHGHDHAHPHDHDHGEDHHDDHAGHDHVAPHGGALMVVGAEYAHFELVLDSSDGTLRAYILDEEAEGALRVTQETLKLVLTDPPGTVTLDAVANALTGETVGDSSEFKVKSALLEGVSSFAGALEKLEVRGRAFSNLAVSYPDGIDERADASQE